MNASTVRKIRTWVIEALAIGWMILAAVPVLAQANDVPRIVIDARKPLGPISPWLTGQNIETADSKGIFGVHTYPWVLRTGAGLWNPDLRQPEPAIFARLASLKPKTLRYPGGCLAHNYDWRKAVGPLDQRGDWLFGIEEYLTLCRLLGAEPVITASDYVLPLEEMPQHLAEMVEYLNAPATPEHPWAMKRAQWGHPEPHNVVWFELGNETDHGNHSHGVIPHRIYSVEQYIQYFLSSAQAMKAIDPRIKIGLVATPGNGWEWKNDWNRQIVAQAGQMADFVAIHNYFPATSFLVPEQEPLLFESYMAGAPQTGYNMDQWRKMIRRSIGRDLPLAMTEYNIGNLPYCHTFAAAISMADFFGELVDANDAMLMSQYWQGTNGAWGFIRTGSNPDEILLRSPYYTAHLWSNHLGSTRLTVRMQNVPKKEFDGYAGVLACKGEKAVAEKKLPPITWPNMTLPNTPNIKGTFTSTGGIRVELKQHTGNVFHILCVTTQLPKVPGADRSTNYELSFRARWKSDSGSTPEKVKFGLGLGDARGWEKTRSAMAVTGAEKALGWTTLSGDYIPLIDCPGMQFVLRLEAGTDQISGVLELEDIRLTPFIPMTFPAYPLLTARATMASDSKTIHLVVINKDMKKEISADVRIRGFSAQKAHRWTLTAPSMNAIDQVKTSETDVAINQAAPYFTRMVFPAVSMTAIDFIASQSNSFENQTSDDSYSSDE